MRYLYNFELHRTDKTFKIFFFVISNKMAKYKIKYDRNKCIGAANCVKIAPDTWKLDDEGLAVQLKKEFTDAELSKQVKAAKSCPTHAIEIYDEAGKKIA
jgi:ferredoxin